METANENQKKMKNAIVEYSTDLTDCVHRSVPVSFVEMVVMTKESNVMMAIRSMEMAVAVRVSSNLLVTVETEY